MASSAGSARWRPVGVAGAVVLLAALMGCAVVGGAAWRAWLGAAFLAISLPVGALGLIMIMRLVPGAWAREASPILEAETLLAPVGALALLPVLIVLPSLYRWMHEAQTTAFRAAWLTPVGFVAVTLVWLIILFALAALLARRPDAPRAVSCIGLILFLVFGTFAATDWLQSLDPDLNSSGFGLYVVCLQILLALAAAIVFALARPEGLPRQGILGGLLLTLLLMWGYFAFMPFFITWSADVPAAAVWYLRRGRGVWGDVAWVVAATRFVPMFLLLFGAVRNDRRWLIWVAGAVLAGSAPEVAWLVLPQPPGGSPSDGVTAALFVAAVAGGGCLCAALMQPARAWIGARP
ncbi:MAG TPA: hypothetical protein VFE18_19250 [Phenylobacterium sp.]|uniref:hypothetical protein n=1 Tax=Phenylobacterium sp. TaxID=1871053 RepID=UPI002D343E45|nr:hypothetical protein [Phenylobacterium sp.]HZZ70312.1 hypothetical protein [Phenylobacterium sp.]